MRLTTRPNSICALRFIRGLFLFEVRAFFKDLKQRVYDQILLRYKQGKKLICFVPDKLGQYLNAFNKFFLYTAKIVFGVPDRVQTIWVASQQ
jgi:hypothetical protein